MDSTVLKEDWPECAGCGKQVQWLNSYFDRNGYYSGKACSNRCSYRLPGQGSSRDYEADHREDDPEDAALDIQPASNNLEMRTLGYQPYWSN